MTPERWQQIKQVLDQSLALRPEERQRYLAKACAGEPGMVAEVQSLIDSYEESADVLDTPAIATGAAVVARHLENSNLGRRIGPYELVEEIGSGGMGTVYRAMRTGEFRQQVAVKLVRRGIDTEYVIQRFRNERQIMAGLEHPNIARLFDGGSTDDGLPYFVMELISGRPILEYCDSHRLNTRERIELFCTVCSAVNYAHKQRVVHRDIKPGNILITADGQPKLLDFGIAKILGTDLAAGAPDPTITMMRMMTPEYASPEQIRGEPVTPASDIYSLGVVLYELLTGHRPYQVRSRAPHEFARAVCEAQPDRPSTAVLRTDRITRSEGEEPQVVSPTSVSLARATDPHRLRRSLSGDLDNIVLMAMRKEPERRYGSVEQLSEDLRRHLAGKPVHARKDALGYRALKVAERYRAALISAVVLCALFGAVMVWTAQSVRSDLRAPQIVPFTSFPGDETQPAFSPDGKNVAFVWAGDEGNNDDIYVKEPATGALLRLTTDPAQDTSPAWSPDGKSLVFMRASYGHTAVYSVPLAGGVERKITEVFPMRFDAAGLGAFLHPLAWSPDGRHLAIADRASVEEPFSIQLTEMANGARRRITLPPDRTIGDTNPAFSPDGSQVSFVRSPSSGVNDLWVTTIRGGVPMRLTFDNRDILCQTWTPDGHYLVFSSNRTGSYDLWRVPASGGRAERLPGIGPGATDPSFSSDGASMAYAQFSVDTNIWRIDLQRTKLGARKWIASTMADSSPAYSPDGKHIAFRSSRSGNHEIWVVDSDGRHAAAVTHFAGPLTGTPRWSPDSKWIAFDSRPKGQADIWVVGAEGGKPRQLTTELSEDVVPNWSRDGKWIYFASNRSGAWQIWKIPAAGGDAEQVTFQGGFAASESPDGRFLYYAKGRSTPGLWRKPVKGGLEEPVLPEMHAGFWGYWAVVHDGIYLFDDAGAEGRGIYFFDFAANRMRPIAAAGNRPMVGDSAFAVSPDERYLLYTQIDQSGSDIMIADYTPH